MPRSTNPNNYEEVYWDLLHAMSAEVAEVTLRMPACNAQKIKFTFFAFIRTLEVQANKLRKQGNMERAASLEEDANAMRKYLVRIDMNGVETTHIAKDNVAPSTLRFINRDLNPETASIREQLKEQLEMLDASTLDRATPVPSIDSFFGKPLEIQDNGDRQRAGPNPGTDPEEPTA